MALNQFADAGIIERYNRSIDPNEFDFVGRAMERKKQQQAAELNQLRILAEQDAMRQAQEEAEAYQIGAQDDALPQLKRRGTKAATTLASKLELDAEARAGKEAKRKADEADAAKSDAESKRKAYEYHIGGVTRFQTPEDIRQHLADGVVKGAYSMEEATAMMRSAPKTAEEIPAWRDSLLRSTMTPEKQVATGSRETIAANNVEQRAEAARNAHEARLQQLTIAAQNAATARERAAFMMEIAREKLEIARLKAAGGASSDGSKPSKPLPIQALKHRQELETQANSLESVNADLGQIVGQIDRKELRLGPVRNIINRAKNEAGFSDPESRKFGDLMATLEKQRNASLLLQKGTQTEGDAQRAWKEIFDRPSDTEYVKDRLKSIQSFNRRAAEQKRKQIADVNANYGRTENVGGSTQAAGAGASKLSAQEQAELDALRKRFGK